MNRTKIIFWAVLAREHDDTGHYLGTGANGDKAVIISAQQYETTSQRRGFRAKYLLELS